MRLPPPFPRHRVLLAAAAAALLVVLPNGCAGEDVVGPAATTGQWLLVSIDGEPVARNAAQAADGGRANIDSAGIIFRRYNRLQDIRHFWRQPDYGPPYFFSDTVITTYQIRADSIFITRSRVVAADTYTDTGRVDGESMEIAVRWYDNEIDQVLFPRWRYARIGETP